MTDHAFETLETSKLNRKPRSKVDYTEYEEYFVEVRARKNRRVKLVEDAFEDFDEDGSADPKAQRKKFKDQRDTRMKRKQALWE